MFHVLLFRLYTYYTHTYIASLYSEVWGEPSSSSKAEEQSKQHDDLNSSILLPTDINYEKLNTSTLQYQKNDDLMMHPNSSSILSMTTSNDGTLLGTTDSNGTICVWKISDGKLLRKIDRAHGGVGGSDKGKLYYGILCVAIMFIIYLAQSTYSFIFSIEYYISHHLQELQ